MSSLITRGYYKYNRIITRGYGTGWLGILRAEIIKRVSKFYKLITADSRYGKW